MDTKDLVKRVKEENVKFVSLQFSDVTGAVKSVDMPVRHLGDALRDGVWFDGSSVEGFARIQESDMMLILDPDTFAVLPWSPEESRRARIFCDIFMPNGEPFEGDPRGTLKRQLRRLDEKGWTFNIGPEPEFFLFKRGNGHGVHPVPHDTGGYFDFSSFDEAVVVRTALMDALDAMGLEVEVGHHEVALGQHEIDFRFADALKTADNVLTLKYTVKAIAAQHGLVASFMPKPVFGINGSGMHCHQSLFDKQTGENVFFDANDGAHLSKTAYSFIAGQLAHARALAAVVAPTVNSYKRLVFTVMLAAALDGIERGLEAPKPLNNINLYHLDAKERRKLGVKELPGSLAEALTELEKDTLLTEALGEVTCEAFLRAKWEEWDQYRLRVSDYEIEQYLEVA
jgi:glutamine synthetase